MDHHRTLTYRFNTLCYQFRQHFCLKGTGITFKELFYLPPTKPNSRSYFQVDCLLHSKHISRKIFMDRWMLTLGLKKRRGMTQVLRWRYWKMPHWHFTAHDKRYWFGRIVIYSPTLLFPNYSRWYPMIKSNLSEYHQWITISWLGILIFQWSKEH